jgi:hypothetical protein
MPVMLHTLDLAGLRGAQVKEHKGCHPEWRGLTYTAGKYHLDAEFYSIATFVVKFEGIFTWSSLFKVDVQ